jgi:excisionase family DNA binding protein
MFRYQGGDVPLDDTVVLDVVAPDSVSGAQDVLRRLIEEALRPDAPALTVRLARGSEARLPDSLSHALLVLVREVLAGHHVEIVAADEEIGMETLAQLLGVSRPTAAQLVDNGVVPFRRTEGGHRRVRLSEALRLRDTWTERRASIAEQVKLGEEHDLPLGPPRRDSRGR